MEKHPGLVLLLGNNCESLFAVMLIAAVVWKNEEFKKEKKYDDANIVTRIKTLLRKYFLRIDPKTGKLQRIQLYFNPSA